MRKCLPLTYYLLETSQAPESVKVLPGSRFTIQREASTWFTIHDSNLKL